MQHCRRAPGPFCYLGTTDPHAFDLDKSFQVLFIGDRRQVRRASQSNFLGAAVVLTPIALDLAVLGLRLDNVIDYGTVTNLLHIIFGVVIILLLIKEPDGLASLIGELAGTWHRPPD